MVLIYGFTASIAWKIAHNFHKNKSKEMVHFIYQPPSFSALSVHMCIHLYMYIYIYDMEQTCSHSHIFICIYMCAQICVCMLEIYTHII